MDSTPKRLEQQGDYLFYYTDKRCVVCNNSDFKRIECGTNKVIQKHKLNHINLGSKTIVFCDSCLYSLKEELSH